MDLPILAQWPTSLQPENVIKTKGFLTFSGVGGSIEMNHWSKMAHLNTLSSLNILYFTKSHNIIFHKRVL